MNPLELTLGIMTAVGGFVDISELVFAAQAGSIFGYALIWVFAFSTVGIMVFGEMSGRVAAVAKQPVFNLMRHRLGLKLGLVTLAASLRQHPDHLRGRDRRHGPDPPLSDRRALPADGGRQRVVLMASMWVLPFKWIERVYGLLGLFMLVFAAALIAIHPPWDKLAGGFVPQVPARAQHQGAAAIRLFRRRDPQRRDVPLRSLFLFLRRDRGGMGPKDLLTNRVTTTVGFGLGSLLAIAILANSRAAVRARQRRPEIPGTAALEAAIPFGRSGLLLALLGMLFAVAGAAVETCMANAYALAQFFGWEWGRHKKPWEAPRFTLAWIVLFVARAADRPDRRRRHEPGRICDPVLDRGPAAHLSAADAARQ